MHLSKLEAARQRQGTDNVAHTAVHQIKANPRWTAAHTHGNYSKNIPQVKDGSYTLLEARTRGRFLFVTAAIS